MIVFHLYLQKKGVTHKKTDIEFIIANRVNKLFKQAIQRFKDDARLWISYIRFCKQLVSATCKCKAYANALVSQLSCTVCVWHRELRLSEV
jgi:hypothetical protein